MPIKFSKDEQAFIDGKLDQNAMEDFLVKNIGNMELNNRVYWKIEEQATLKEKQSDDPTLLTSDQIDNLKLLERWAYKTPTAQEIKSIANKIKIAKQLQAQGIELLPEEKISLLELKQISRFSLLLGKKDSFRKGDKENKKAKDVFNPLSQEDKAILQQIYEESTNKEFRELYENMVVCEELTADLRRDILKSHAYKAGDILIRNEAKSAVIENVAQEGITSLKEKDTVILFDKNIDNSYINDAFEADLIEVPSKNSFKIEKKSESLKDYEHTQKINFLPKSPSSAIADISKLNVTDILSSNIYRLPKDKLNDANLMKQIQAEKDPKKLEALLVKHDAEKVPNSIAEEFVRTDDVKKSKSFNNIEDNLANTLETLTKSCKDPGKFVKQATSRIQAYLEVSGAQSIGNFRSDLETLYFDRNKSGLKVEIIKFISNTLVTLGLKKSTAEKTIQKIRGPFTKQLSDRNRNNTMEKQRTSR